MVVTDIASDVAEVVRQIVDQFQPRRIVLFGSHATGLANDGSDVDLLVVMESPRRPLQQAAAISRALDHRVPVDILIRTPDQVTMSDPRDLILREINRDGVVVYEAGD